MVIEGHKFQFLASGSHTRSEHHFPQNIDHRQKHVLLTKCAYLVYEMTNYALNRDPFSLKFLDMIGAHENFHFFLLASSTFSSPEKHNFALRAYYCYT